VKNGPVTATSTRFKLKWGRFKEETTLVQGKCVSEHIKRLPLLPLSLSYLKTPEAGVARWSSSNKKECRRGSTKKARS